MSSLDIALSWGAFSTTLGIVAALRWRKAELIMAKLADAKVYWQHQAWHYQARCAAAEASQRGRHARACQMSQTRAKVLTKALQINQELGR